MGPVTPLSGGDENGRHVHVHPGRWTTNTCRVRANVLKTAVVALAYTTVANILNLEFLVHACDFATATGQTLEVSPALSGYVLELARNTISPQMRGASFAEETLVDESAASLDRLVAFTGRPVAAR